MDIVLAALAGALVMVQMSLNSALGLRIGVFRATAVNYIVGLGGVGLVALVWGGVTAPTVAVPWFAWLGGVLGVIVVSASNVVLPRIPVVAAAGLLFLGQIVAGLAVDAVRQGTLDIPKLVGAVLVLGGLAQHQFVERKKVVPEAEPGGRP